MSANAMQDLIGVVNELHDALSEVKVDLKLDLPQIAVIGSQSSGKSSVLENIVGKDFLPRGSNIVTRCPLVLQLVQLPNSEDEEWGEFHHKSGKKFHDFSEIREEIERRTNEMTSSGKGFVTANPINLKVFSRNVLNLTLVDLPGLVMNAVGDQPADIDRQIKEMVTHFVKPSNTIMLAVTPANADIATSAALRLAKQLDPQGERTLGVLTKLDLMDRGVDACEMLEGRLIPLQLGFIGVVNRSQADINSDKSMEAARASEKEYFDKHPAYSRIADKQGTEYLAKTLSKVLLHHIQKNLPELKSHIDKLVSTTRKQQESLGMLDDVPMDNGARMLQFIKEFSDSINKSIEGEAIEGAKELVGGARIDYIFHECFTPYVTSMKASKELTDNFIRLTIRNRSGMQSTLFPSDQVFITLAKQQVKRLEDPSTKCVNFIYDELLKIIDQCVAKFDRFPNLRTRFVDAAQAQLRKYRYPTTQHIKTIIQAEAGYINIKHPYMQEVAARVLGQRTTPVDANGAPLPSAAGGGGAPPAGSPIGGANSNQSMIDVPRNIQLGQSMSQQETSQNAQIRDMVEAYFGLVQRNVIDQVPKVIALLMISQLCQDLYPTLIQELYKESLYEELLSESKDISAKRKATAAMMKVLKKAQGALGRVRDLN